ncbi:hypothetical protein BJD20_14705 [Acinetobacter proteolyticus]|uniref:hypothetical protein n=1 Tax=Acinetobacter proteolyticus TaxID=1776741 RepID=UPI00086356DC|nr:hypothetical protein [Acinetobacter proteolyticus]OEY95338.1 hypothetical protein BJD20_14705 [Acinetobacter proteolyticus]
MKDWFKTNLGLVIILLATLIYLFAVLSITDLSAYHALKLNEKGDLLAGIFSPLAFLWLVYGYLQQGQELKLNTQALTMQANELAISNSSLQTQCEELAESVRQQTELVLTAKEELRLTVTQHEQINKQELIQAQPYFHISDIKVKVIEVNETMDINISFKIKNSRTLCRSLFFLLSINEEALTYIPDNSTSFELLENSISNYVPAYVQSTIRGDITEYFNSEILLHFCYADAYDAFQEKKFKIKLINENPRVNLSNKTPTIYVYDSCSSVRQIFY